VRWMGTAEALPMPQLHLTWSPQLWAHGRGPRQREHSDRCLRRNDMDVSRGTPTSPAPPGDLLASSTASGRHGVPSSS
jgi:hypothetical protein